jgi:uncharacterized protein with von Willebrand factor type A (vWA) domain
MLDAAVAFGRVLRGAGLRVGTDRIVEFSRALEELDVTRREDVYWSGRATLLSRPEDTELYDRAFRLFWDMSGNARSLALSRNRASVTVPEDSVAPPKKTVEENEQGKDAVTLRYSPEKQRFRAVLARRVCRVAEVAGRPSALGGAAEKSAVGARATRKA